MLEKTLNFIPAPFHFSSQSLSPNMSQIRDLSRVTLNYYAIHSSIVQFRSLEVNDHAVGEYHCIGARMPYHAVFTSHAVCRTLQCECSAMLHTSTSHKWSHKRMVCKVFIVILFQSIASNLILICQLRDHRCAAAIFW